MRVLLLRLEPVSYIDIEAPSVPANLSVLSKSDTSIKLTWIASIDNIGVYRV